LALERAGKRVVLVSSGAIAAGRALLRRPRPKSLPELQALAAAGQPELMRAWKEAFSPRAVAQVLLDAGDLADRRRFLNAKNTLETLLGWGVVPVVNENDTVMTEEIQFGDNDQLAVLVAGLVEAEAWWRPRRCSCSPTWTPSTRGTPGRTPAPGRFASSSRSPPRSWRWLLPARAGPDGGGCARSSSPQKGRWTPG